MIHVIASIHIHPGKKAEFIKIFKSIIPDVHREQGCVAYAPTVDVPTGLEPQQLDADVVTIIEQWETLEDLRAHLIAPHMLAYRPKVADLVSNVSLRILTEA
ncbi:MAG TPA: antibiotic biosynthesis monooxygenase [Verrucomicrobia bacterium]|nr:antibiotic biosynthesis monooxygenase [Verrucomicrobiota bacterium]